MKGIHPIRKCMILAVTTLFLVLAYMGYFVPQDNEYREVHAQVMQQSSEGSQLSGVLMPLVELQARCDAAQETLQKNLSTLRAAPTTETVLGEVGSHLAQRQLTLSRFSPIVTAQPIAHSGLEGEQLLLDRFQVEFRARLVDLLALLDLWGQLPFSFRIERMDLLQTSAESQRIQVQLLCTILSVRPKPQGGETPRGEAP